MRVSTESLPASKSDWNVEVVRVGEIVKHPAADTLGIVNANGYPVIVKLGDFREGDLAVYVPVDSIVPVEKPCFSFLKSPRVRAVKLRGIYSQGLLIPITALPVPGPPWEPGQNVAGALGVSKYLTPSERAELGVPGTPGAKRPPTRKLDFHFPVYGVDPLRRFSEVLRIGDEVVLTEKIHGCNARYVYRNGKLYVGSHKTVRGATRHRVIQWLDQLQLKVRRVLGFGKRTDLFERAGDVWWEAAKKYDLEEQLRDAPNLIIYGEIYGQGVQDLTYDAPNCRKFRIFDVYDLEACRWLDYDDVVEFAEALGLETPPLIYRGPWEPSLVAEAEGPTLLGGGHVREGFVVRTVFETVRLPVGRVSLKCVGEGYNLRKGAS